MYILSCEPATCAIPEWHKELFRGYEEVVTSTEGWAPGSLNLAQAFATKLRTLLAHGDITRLLIDFSKRPGDPERFSRFGTKLTDDHKRRLDERHHLAHIKLLKHRIEEEIRKEGKAIHLSFRTDHRPDMSTVELVQDISRDLETGLVRRWAEALRSAAPERPRIDRSALQAELTRTLAEALYMDAAAVDPRKPFAEMGLDSIIGVEWVRVINRRFDLRMVAARIYDYPSVERLTQHLVQQLE